MKKLLCVLLAACLVLTPALAATADLFPALRAYAGFSDVTQGSWYEGPVQTCYETGLMSGIGNGQFAPMGTMSVAESATIAARIREAVTAERIPFATPKPGETRLWYEDYVAYLTAAGIPVEHPASTATRAQFFALLAAVVPTSELAPINAITALPDTSDPAVLTFYNAGVLTGTDAYGTFSPAGTLSRAECAAMVARIIRPELRQRFTPQSKTPKPAPTYEEELNSAAALIVDGEAVSMSDFVNAMDQIIYQVDVNQLRYTGQRLDWNAKYTGIDDLEAYFLAETQRQVIRGVVMGQTAKAMGCQVTDLAKTLTPDPGQAVLSAYAEGMGYLAAKHILLPTKDTGSGGVIYGEEQAIDLAGQIVSALDAEPTPQQFDNLIQTFNEDPGMKSNPEGYLFTAGQMVSEFENAVRELEFNEYTATPVKSTYGYHIILRRDPAELTELKTIYQDAVLEQLVNSWVASATVTPNKVMLEQISVRGCYEAYLNMLSGS